MEKHTRTILKSISWRAVATLDTILIAWLVTGRIKFALSIGGIEVITKMVIYYVHERIWNKIKFGRRIYIKD